MKTITSEHTGMKVICLDNEGNLKTGMFKRFVSFHEGEGEFPEVEIDGVEFVVGGMCFRYDEETYQTLKEIGAKKAWHLLFHCKVFRVSSDNKAIL